MQIEGENVEAVRDFLFLGSKITVDGDDSQETRRLSSWQECYDKPRQCTKKQRHHFADKVITRIRFFLSSWMDVSEDNNN